MIEGYDHVAITTQDVQRSFDFYGRVLGAELLQDFPPDGPVAVRAIRIGGAALNIHQQGNGLWLVARDPVPGSADLCFRWRGTIDTAVAHLKAAHVPIIEGPSPRFDAAGTASLSVYFRDPDGNLLEFMSTEGVDHGAIDLAATFGRARAGGGQ